MLPTRPRSSARSMCSSCTAPFSTTATRVSCGAQLMRMSCMSGTRLALSEANARALQQLRRLEERQTHDTGVASVDALDPGRDAALDRVGAGLAERLAAGDIAVDVGRRDPREAHVRRADGQPLPPPRHDRDGGDRTGRAP